VDFKHKLKIQRALTCPTPIFIAAIYRKSIITSFFLNNVKREEMGTIRNKREQIGTIGNKREKKQNKKYSIM
jgi:hypothetical protein